jgi:hypothetical protein
MLTYCDIEYTDPDTGKPKKADAVAVNGCTPRTLSASTSPNGKQFGDAPITKLTRVTDSAKSPRPRPAGPDMPAEVVKKSRMPRTPPTRRPQASPPPKPSRPHPHKPKPCPATSPKIAWPDQSGP